MAEKPHFSILIGLGNPGDEYANTFHNAGKMALDIIAKEIQGKDQKTIKSKKFSYSKTDRFILVWPLTFMNESGEAAANAINYFKLDPTEALVLHDDSDLAIGKCKLEKNRGSAGHHGIESIFDHLRTRNFWRLRIGVRKNNAKASDFVLANMTKEEKASIYGAIESALTKVISK